MADDQAGKLRSSSTEVLEEKKKVPNDDLENQIDHLTLEFGI